MVRAYCLPGPWRSVRASASGSAAAGSKAYSLTVVPMKAARSVSQRDHQPWLRQAADTRLEVVVGRRQQIERRGEGRQRQAFDDLEAFRGMRQEALEQGSRLECVAQ